MKMKQKLAKEAEVLETIKTIGVFAVTEENIDDFEEAIESLCDLNLIKMSKSDSDAYVLVK